MSYFQRHGAPTPKDRGATGSDATIDTTAINDALDTFGAVSLDQDYTINSSIVVPTNGTILGNGFKLTKSGNIDMVTLGNAGKLYELFLRGAGGTYTGRGITISTGNDQKIINCDVQDVAGYCLELTQPDVMIRGEVSGGTWQCTGATLEAIKLFGSSPWDTPGTNSDTATSGGRSFVNIYGGGGPIMDVSGGNVTEIIAPNTTGITFRDNGSRYCTIVGGRYAGNITLKGHGHVILGNTCGGTITLGTDAADCHIYLGPTSSTVTDNSGNSTNNIYGQYATFTPTWTAASGTPDIGNGSLSGYYYRNGRSVRVTVIAVFGSTTNFDSSTQWSFVLPSPYDQNWVGSAVGSVYALDSGTGHYAGSCYVVAGAPAIKLFTGGSSSAEWDYNNPIVWANGDTIVATVEGTLG